MQNTSDRTREQQRSLERVGEVGHANCVTRTELTSCVSARPEAMSRRCRGDVEASCDAVLSFLDQFDVPARSPPANEPNNPALTLREVEEGLANRTPRRYASLRNSFERDRVSSIEDAARRREYPSICIDLRIVRIGYVFLVPFERNDRDGLQNIHPFVTPLPLSKIVYAEFLAALVSHTR